MKFSIFVLNYDYQFDFDYFREFKNYFTHHFMTIEFNRLFLKQNHCFHGYLYFLHSKYLLVFPSWLVKFTNLLDFILRFIGFHYLCFRQFKQIKFDQLLKKQLHITHNFPLILMTFLYSLLKLKKKLQWNQVIARCP